MISERTIEQELFTTKVLLKIYFNPLFCKVFKITGFKLPVYLVQYMLKCNVRKLIKSQPIFHKYNNKVFQ